VKSEASAESASMIVPSTQPALANAYGRGSTCGRGGWGEGVVGDAATVAVWGEGDRGAHCTHPPAGDGGGDVGQRSGIRISTDRDLPGIRDNHP
jgi:hypothetical protein